MKFIEIAILLAIVFIFFGAGKLPNVMEDLGKGLKSFKKAMSDDDGEKSDKSSS